MGPSPRPSPASDGERVILSQFIGFMLLIRSFGSAIERSSKRQRTAALQNLAEGVAGAPSRQRLGVRLSSAAFVIPFARAGPYVALMRLVFRVQLLLNR